MDSCRCDRDCGLRIDGRGPLVFLLLQKTTDRKNDRRAGKFELVAGGDREEYGVKEVDGKEPMQVVTGDRRQLCVVRVLKTIRLRELRNVLIDELVDDFKDQPVLLPHETSQGGGARRRDDAVCTSRVRRRRNIRPQSRSK